MLQGYLFDANFGDMLSAYLFYKRCQDAGFEQVDFFQYKAYGIGQFCREQIGYTAKKSLLSCFFADALVIISGGSFWNDKSKPADAKVRFRRFVLPALFYQLLHKPVYVLGVGGGPVDTPWLRQKMVKMLNKAKVVTFRDEETKKIFDGYGVKETAVTTADTLLTINEFMLDKLQEKVELETAARGRKKLLLHIPDGTPGVTCVADVILPALIRFLHSHDDYLIVLSHDNIREKGEKEQRKIDQIRTTLTDAGIDYFDYDYHDCWQMCSLLAEMDCVITLKLHVGAIAAALGKSVVSFPIHREKTDYFYQMIGEYDRCVNVSLLDTETAYSQIQRFHDRPVRISDELRKKAEMNLSVLDEVARRKC